MNAQKCYRHALLLFQIIKEEKEYEDLSEVAKLFNFYGEPEEEASASS